MKICLKCDFEYNSHDWHCPLCGCIPKREKSRIVFSPEISENSNGFESHFFEDLYSLESNSFWFRSRNKLILAMMKKYFPNINNFMEIGCGTGFVLSAIEREFPKLVLYGSEIFNTGLDYAVTRVSRADLFQMDARKIPFKDEFDAIGAFDVLEHIEDDVKVLNRMYQAVKPGGSIILTVPQHKFLWSENDVYAHHVRRYSANELKSKVKSAGFKVIRATSFVSLLFPFFFLSRLRWKIPMVKYDSMSEYKIGSLMNNLLEKVLSFEISMIKVGFHFCLGSSLLLVAHKRNI